MRQDLLGAQVVVKERPPEGLARGRWEAPRWAIAVLGAVVLLGALAFLLTRARRGRRPQNGRAP